MDLKDLKGFVAVAEVSGFRRAAEKLNIEQSALSRRIRNLEDRLGVSLFERHRGGTRLTRAGERFLCEVRIVLAGLDVAVAHATSAGTGQDGSLRLGVGATLFGGHMRRIMEAWLQRHPKVRLHIVEGSPQEHIASILCRSLDVAIVAGKEWSGNIEFEVLWNDQVNVVVPKSIEAQFSVPVQTQDLVSRTYIVSRNGFGPQVRDWIVRRLSNLSTSPHVEFVDASRGILLSMVGSGLGLTFATSAEADVEYPTLAFLPVEKETIPYSAIWSADNDNPALRRFLSLTRTLVRPAKLAAP